jgi:hypothetical protein
LHVWIRFLLVVAVQLALAGCYSAIATRRVPIARQGEIAGLAVNHNTAHRVIAVFPKSMGSRDLTIEQTTAMLPERGTLYEVNYTGALFRSRELKVELHADTTLKKIELNDVLSLPEDLAALREAAAAVQPVKTAIDEAKQKPTAAEVLGLENAALQAQILNAMLKANLEAVQSGEQPVYPVAK